MVELHDELPHSWDLTPKEAIALQQELAAQVVTENRLGNISTVAGIDVGFEAGNTITRAAVAVLDFPSLELRESALARQPTSFPYIPGLLSFREAPAILRALTTLEERPDLLLIDGQGRAHPRRLGIASHLGLLVDIPAIGVAKSRLVGHPAAPLPAEKGSWQPLLDGDEVIGAVVRTRSNVKPLYISVGHRIDLETAIDYVLACTTRFKLPETTRHAHRLASG